MNPRAATSRWQASVWGCSPLTVTTTASSASTPTVSLTCALVITRTAVARNACSDPGWARNVSRRCTSVTLRATGCSISAQSTALSPPPTITTSVPT